MSKAIGIDIVEFNQIKEKLNERFIKRILSKNELGLIEISYQHSSSTFSI